MDTLITNFGTICGPDTRCNAHSSKVPEPIIVRGAGDLSVFGLNNRFCPNYPAELVSRVAPEEYDATLNRINELVEQSLPVNLIWLFCGCIFCICTLGCSLWPVICLSKKTEKSIEKMLEIENISLYNKLGMQWSLIQRQNEASLLLEYALLLEFIPALQIYSPD